MTSPPNRLKHVAKYLGGGAKLTFSDQDIVTLYNGGLNIMQIAKIVGQGRETVRVCLKRNGVRMRFRGIKYDPLPEHTHTRKVSLAELFGYFVGDGSVSKRKDGRYDCTLSLALKEKDFVDRVIDITRQLFDSIPKVESHKDYFKLVFRRSIGRYLCEQCGCPAGKKSVVNPHVPSWIMQSSSEVKVAFIRGFLNAEASVSDCVKVAQSVRVSLPETVKGQLKLVSSINSQASYRYYSARWRDAKALVAEHVRPSNILVDLQKMLSEFHIDAKMYLNRVWMNSNCSSASVHYELYMSKKMLNRLKQFNMVTKGK